MEDQHFLMDNEELPEEEIHSFASTDPDNENLSLYRQKPTRHTIISELV
jgi:hypothetical protein